MSLYIKRIKLKLELLFPGKNNIFITLMQFSSVSDPDLDPEPDLDPDSGVFWIRIQNRIWNPDPDSESRSGSRGLKKGQKC